MLRSTKSWFVAALAVGLALAICTTAQSAPLPGIYWAALDSGNANTGGFFYAPLPGTGTSTTAYQIGTIADPPVGNQQNSVQLTFMQVLEVGGTNYVYWSGCCGNNDTTYRAPLLNSNNPATMAIDFANKVQVRNYQNRAFAVDVNAPTPQLYSSDSNATLDRFNATNGTSQTPVDTRSGQQYDAFHIYTSGSTTHLLVGMRENNGIFDYVYPTGGVADGVSEATIVLPTQGGGDLYDIARTSTGDIYYVGGGTRIYKNAIATPFVSGTGGEIKQFALDDVNGYLYYADADNSALGLLKRVKLSDQSLSTVSTDIASDNALRAYAMFIVTAQEAEGVPEPSTFILAALGLAGLSFVVWKRRRSL